MIIRQTQYHEPSEPGSIYTHSHTQSTPSAMNEARVVDSANTIHHMYPERTEPLNKFYKMKLR